MALPSSEPIRAAAPPAGDRRGGRGVIHSDGDGQNFSATVELRDGIQLALTMDTGRARRGDAPTSIASARAVDVPARCKLVFDFLDDLHGGGRRDVTAHDITDALAEAGIDMPANTVARRLLDLERADRAERHAPVVSKFGRACATWRPR